MSLIQYWNNEFRSVHHWVILFQVQQQRSSSRHLCCQGVVILSWWITSVKGSNCDCYKGKWCYQESCWRKIPSCYCKLHLRTTCVSIYVLAEGSSGDLLEDSTHPVTCLVFLESSKTTKNRLCLSFKRHQRYMHYSVWHRNVSVQGTSHLAHLDTD